MTLISVNASLLDDEIETTKRLIDLYEQKMALMINQSVGPTADLDYFDSLSMTSDEFQLSATGQIKEVKLDEKSDHESTQDAACKISLINEMFKFPFKDSHAQLVSIKPIGKNSSGKQLTVGVAVASGAQIEIRDIYDNLLIKFELSNPSDSIIQIAGQPAYQSDVSIIAALTEQNAVYSFDFRPAKAATNERSAMPFKVNQKYKTALEQHKYVPHVRTYKTSQKGEPSHLRHVDLISLVPSDLENADRKFKHLVTTFGRPDKPFYVVLDSLNVFWILDKHLRLHGIVRSSREVSSLSVKGTTTVFSQGSNIVFLDAEKAELGQATCKSPRNVMLHGAVFDNDSSSFVYGLSLESMEVFVFKVVMGSSNIPTEC
jgi:hypothetical protein